MPASGALGVEGMDRATLERGDCVFDKTAFVQRVGVDHRLHIHCVGNGQATVDTGRGRAPVFMQLQRARTGQYLFLQRGRQRRVALAGKGEIHRKRVGRLQHALDMPGAGRAGGGVGAGRRTRAATQHRRDAGHQRLLDLLRTDEMNVGIETAGRQYLTLTGDCLGAGPDDNVHTILRVRVAGLADRVNSPVANTDISLVDAVDVDDQRVGDNGIDGAAGPIDLRLAHAVTNHLAAAELHLIAVGGPVVLDLDDEIRIGEAHLVAGRRTVHRRVSAARN